MARYTYTALVTRQLTHAVKVTVEVPDGKSPWGPFGREAARTEALKEATTAGLRGDAPQTRTTVQFSHAQKQEA